MDIVQFIPNEKAGFSLTKGKSLNMNGFKSKCKIQRKRNNDWFPSVIP